jgi:hypothetical protein
VHEKHLIEKELKKEAKRLSVQYGNAPVVAVVGGAGGVWGGQRGVSFCQEMQSTIRRILMDFI